jgi:hypothetical protein
MTKMETIKTKVSNVWERVVRDATDCGAVAEGLKIEK